MMKSLTSLLLASMGSCFFLCAQPATITRYLSGSDYGEGVQWDFKLSEGRGAGRWATIPVPSCWELEGFGTYNYGHAKDSARGKEVGHYRHRFEVPGHWEGHQIEIVFEGVMTDAVVRINGQKAGPVHQGAFYSFRYDITGLVAYGESNLLEVTVAKHSANESVNKAERYADYWIFGGIFRPVFLEVKPWAHMGRLAIDARADGLLTAEVQLHNAPRQGELTVQLLTMDDEPVGQVMATPIHGPEVVTMEARYAGVEPWEPEHPHLYQAKFQLVADGEVLHEMTERIGFRTIEVRPRDGIYINGVQVKFKGVNHHSFWPESGRATSQEMSVRDVLLMKDMNMNAVRTSHYPPDKHFLDACDSLGLFVLEELAGWHDAYDREVGSRLLREMVLHDQNHPSIVIWDNGNEGGHNPHFDDLFRQYDLQDRLVIHPWEEFNGTATQHYRGYDYGVGTFWHGHQITFPTEFLHGLYDGGSGAGLQDFWDLIWKKPRAAGGFLWVFADEGVMRTDLDGRIDCYGEKAADGILSPYHQKEASYYAIKEVWSPVQLTAEDVTLDFDGAVQVENRYLYTNLKECRFGWKLVSLANSVSSGGPPPAARSGGIPSPDIAPGRIGELEVALPADWKRYDALQIASFGPDGNELYTHVLPIKLPKDYRDALMQARESAALAYRQTASEYVITAAANEFTLSRRDGTLTGVANERGAIPFRHGPELCAGQVVFSSLQLDEEPEAIRVTASFDDEASRLKEFTWSFYPNGLAELDIYYVPEQYDVPFDYMGVSFQYPEALVQGVRWLGEGPYRVWKNRTQGVELGEHQKAYNDVAPGVYPVAYPEFKGYHARLYWAEIQSAQQHFVIGTSSEDVFLRLFTPALPEDPRIAPPFPDGDISFLQAIPPIGTKTNPAANLGPSGQQNVFFDFGPYDDWRTRCKRMTLYFDFTAR